MSTVTTLTLYETRERIRQSLQTQSYSIVVMSERDDDYGLYVTGFRNEFGTGLVGRGSMSDLTDLL